MIIVPPRSVRGYKETSKSLLKANAPALSLAQVRTVKELLK